MPGSIIANMPPQDDDDSRAVRDLQRHNREMQSQAQRVFAAELADLRSQLIAMFESTYYTMAETDAAIATKVASPGDIAPVNVTASGQVQSNGAPLKSLPTHDYIVHVGNWVAAWTDGDGTVGTSSSSGAVKVDLSAMDAADAARLLTITPYWGRYMWDDPSSPPKVFVLAEDVQAAGFGPDVAPIVSDEPMNISADPDIPVMVEPGHAWTVNYSQLVVPLLAVVKQQQEQLDTLVSRLSAAGIA